MSKFPVPDNSCEFFDQEHECMTREQIEALQVERLKETIARCMKNPIYKQRLDEAGITPDSITCVADVRKLPFTTKQDLRENYPFGLACVPLRDCVRLHSSSGTTGNPTVILHTQNDLDEWANQVARNLWMVGLRPEDVFQNSSGYGMFTGGLGFQYGAERLGMLTVPAAAGNSLRQIKFIRDFGTTALHAVPSYVTRLYEVMQEQGVDPRKDTKLKVLAIGAEPHSEEQRNWLDEELTDLKPVNAEQMKIILSTYRIESSKIDICIWQNPVSSYIPEDLMGHGGDGPFLAMAYKNKSRRMLSLTDGDIPVPSSSSEAR